MIVFARALVVLAVACEPPPTPIAAPEAPPAAPRLDAVPAVDRPAGRSLRIAIDRAHHNLHTIDGRYGAFAELLRRDGHVVTDGDALPDRAIDLFVVANASAELGKKNAFTSHEVAAIERWTREGGALLLIADHAPYGGAVKSLARVFGATLADGYTTCAGDAVPELLRRADGTLADHAVTRGRDPAEAIDHLAVFLGSAFAASPELEPIARCDAAAVTTIGDREFPTPRAVIGAVRRFGRGRVAVFGEAGLFTAYAQAGMQIGFSHPEAHDNPRFVLNLVHWLGGELDGGP